MHALPRSAFLAGTAAAALSPLAAHAADLPTIRIGSGLTDLTLQMYYAQDNGMFAAAGINPEISILRSTADILAGLVGGSFDVMVGDIMTMAGAYSHGTQLKAIALAAVYQGGPPDTVIAVPAGSAVRGAADLKGKTLGVNALHSAAHVESIAWMTNAGVDPNEVKILEVPFPAMAGALEQGRVDAAVMAEPFKTVAGDKIRVVGNPVAAIGKNFAILAWWASPTWLAANKALAQKYADVMIRAAKWANHNHDASAEILSKYSKIPVALIKKTTRSVYGEVPPSPELFRPMLEAGEKYAGLPRIDPAALIWRG